MRGLLQLRGRVRQDGCKGRSWRGARDCCTAGEGLEQARGEFVAAVAKGWERGEVVNACDAAAKRRDGSGDVATAAALLRMGGWGSWGLLHWGAERCAPQGAPQQKGLCVRKVCTRVGRRHAERSGESGAAVPWLVDPEEGRSSHEEV